MKVFANMDHATNVTLVDVREINRGNVVCQSPIVSEKQGLLKLYWCKIDYNEDGLLLSDLNASWALYGTLRKNKCLSARSEDGIETCIII